MRTHEGKTRYMNPIYLPKHAVAEGQESGFTYGVLSRFIPFRDLPGKHRDGKPFRYNGLSDLLRDFFNKIFLNDERARESQRVEQERLRREERASYDTITIAPVQQTGRHHLREDNQWPSTVQTMMAEATY